MGNGRPAVGAKGNGRGMAAIMPKEKVNMWGASMGTPSWITAGAGKGAVIR